MKYSQVKNSKSLALAGLIVVSLLAIGGCSDTHYTVPDETPVVFIAPPDMPEPLSVIISGSVLDKSTGNVIDSATVSFFEGANVADSILDIYGNAITSVSLTNGSFQVTTKDDITSFTMVVTADGYFDNALDVGLELDAETVVAQVSLIAKEAEGVSVVEVEAPVVAATVAQEVSVTTEEQPGETDTTVGSAEVVIPAAVQLQDAQGNPVSGSTLKVEVAYIESQEVEAGEAAEEATSIAAIIPEGLNDDAVSSEVLVPIGVAEINMTDENGTEIKQFSDSSNNDAFITITVNLPEDTDVPSAGRTVQTGDQFTVRSYDEETRLWSTEDNAVVGALVNGVYPASLQVNHLTLFALTDPVPVCENNVSFEFSGDAIPASSLVMSLQSDDLNQSGVLTPEDSAGAVLSATGDKFIALADAPTAGSASNALGLSVNASATVIVKDLSGNVWFNSNQEVALCGETISVALDNPAVDENLTVSLVCTNDTQVTNPFENAVVTYRKDTNSAAVVATEGAAGSYALTGLDPTLSQYLVSVDTRGDAGIQSTTITPDGTDESLQISASCPEVTGTGTGSS
jgi:hypothetical protein